MLKDNLRDIRVRDLGSCRVLTGVLSFGTSIFLSILTPKFAGRRRPQRLPWAGVGAGTRRPGAPTRTPLSLHGNSMICLLLRFSLLLLSFCLFLSVYCFPFLCTVCTHTAAAFRDLLVGWCSPPQWASGRVGQLGPGLRSACSRGVRVLGRP